MSDSGRKRAQGKAKAMRALKSLFTASTDTPPAAPKKLSPPKKEIIPVLKEWQFTPGRLYRIHGRLINGLTPESTAERERLETLRFLRDEGKHHMFISPRGYWRTTFTDAQLARTKITQIG